MLCLDGLLNREVREGIAYVRVLCQLKSATVLKTDDPVVSKQQIETTCCIIGHCRVRGHEDVQ